MNTCKHCDRGIVLDNEKGWIDPQANGDDSVWRETCDSHDTFTAEHEPPFDVLSFIMTFEDDDNELTEDDVVEGFQHLIDTGMIYNLQGFYGRIAEGLADRGLVTL